MEATVKLKLQVTEKNKGQNKQRNLICTKK